MSILLAGIFGTLEEVNYGGNMPTNTDISELENHLSADAAVNVQAWLEQPKYAEYHEELEQMIANEQWQDLEVAFFETLYVWSHCMNDCGNRLFFSGFW